MKKTADAAVRARLQLGLSMVIFGTIGVFRTYIPLPSGLLALCRGPIGLLFLLGLMRARGQGLNRAAIRGNLPLLCLSGGIMGFNWILLFEAYRFTTVATATLCYYMAPVFVVLLSPLALGERLTLRKGLCALMACGGMALVSGLPGSGGENNLLGVALGLGAALLYAGVMLLNQKIHNVPGKDKTIVQLGAAALALLPYVLWREPLTGSMFTLGSVGMLLVVGIVHTGIAYALYFGAMEPLPGQTVAQMSYIDPIVAVLLSAVMGQPLSVLGWIGAAVILCATWISEMQSKKR